MNFLEFHRMIPVCLSKLRLQYATFKGEKVLFTKPVTDHHGNQSGITKWKVNGLWKDNACMLNEMVPNPSCYPGSYLQEVCDGPCIGVNKSQAVTIAKRKTGFMKNWQASVTRIKFKHFSLHLSHLSLQPPSILLPAIKTQVIELEQWIEAEVNTLIIENRPSVRVRNRRWCLLSSTNSLPLISAQKSRLSLLVALTLEYYIAVLFPTWH